MLREVLVEYERKIDSAEYVQAISIVNDWAQKNFLTQLRPEAESSIRGSVQVVSYSLEPRHPS